MKKKFSRLSLLFILSFLCSFTSNDSIVLVSKLSSLGVTKEEIRKMDYQTINALKETNEIYIYQTYYKDNENGQIQIDKDEYNKAIKLVKSKPESTEDIFNDKYMTIKLIVSHINEDKYHIYSFAKWDRAPFYRTTDSFSVCGNDFVPIASSANGYVTYTETAHVTSKHRIKRKDTVSYHNETIKSEDIEISSNENLSGMGYLTNLPNDKVIVALEYKYTDYTTYLSFDTRLNTPSIDHNFNVIAAYDHTEKKIKCSANIII